MSTIQRLAAVTLFVSALAGLSAGAHASYIALDSTRTSGNQSYTGALGMDFNVISAINVTELGAYDGLPVGFADPVSVGIFDRNTGLLVGVSAVLTTANSTPGGTQNRFFDIADFVLGPGQYSIVADGFSAAEMNGNTGLGGSGPTIDTGGGLIAFTGTSRFGSPTTGLVFPTIIDGGPANRYDAGTFRFTAAVPEPGTLALAGLALFGLAALRRRAG